MPLLPEREKVRGPAFGRELCTDDLLPLPSCALAKDKMPAEWLLISKLGLLRSSHTGRFLDALASLEFKPPKLCAQDFQLKNHVFK